MAKSGTVAGPSAINILFVAFVAGGVVFAAFNERMPEISTESFEAAKSSVELSLSLIGVMALWLGLVRVLEAGGLMYSLARVVRPLMSRLFPDVPSEHPAMSAMLLNISANLLGLGNAATPLGIKAMIELNRLNPIPGTATNAMCLFLAINTSSVTLLPLGVIGVRAAAGATEPANIFLPTLLATLCSTLVAIFIALLFARRDRAYLEQCSHSSAVNSEKEASTEIATEEEDYSNLRGERNSFAVMSSWAFLLAFCAAMFLSFQRSDYSLQFLTKTLPTYWLMPGLMLLIVCYGLLRGVKIYEAVTEGAKQGFEIAVKIIPFLVAILVAIGLFRASGAMESLASLIEPLTGLIGMPAEVLPMALVRPLSGTGAFGIMSALVAEAPNSYSAFLASTMQGSTETTFYVLAVYFGAVGVVRIRHAVVAALCADFAGVLASCFFAQLFWAA